MVLPIYLAQVPAGALRVLGLLPPPPPAQGPQGRHQAAALLLPCLAYNNVFVVIFKSDGLTLVRKDLD